MLKYMRRGTEVVEALGRALKPLTPLCFQELTLKLVRKSLVFIVVFDLVPNDERCDTRAKHYCHAGPEELKCCPMQLERRLSGSIELRAPETSSSSSIVQETRINVATDRRLSRRLASEVFFLVLRSFTPCCIRQRSGCSMTYSPGQVASYSSQDARATRVLLAYRPRVNTPIPSDSCCSAWRSWLPMSASFGRRFCCAPLKSVVHASSAPSLSGAPRRCVPQVWLPRLVFQAVMTTGRREMNAKADKAVAAGLAKRDAEKQRTLHWGGGGMSCRRR